MPVLTSLPPNKILIQKMTQKNFHITNIAGLHMAGVKVSIILLLEGEIFAHLYIVSRNLYNYCYLEMQTRDNI